MQCLGFRYAGKYEGIDEGKKGKGKRRKGGTFFFEVFATIFTSELRNVFFGEFVKGFVQYRAESGDAGIHGGGIRSNVGRKTSRRYVRREERERARGKGGGGRGIILTVGGSEGVVLN